jgi:RNA polymerase sigma-70 factor (ECF subfamily)
MKSPAVSAGINDSEGFDVFFSREWPRLVAFCCAAFRLPRAVAEEVAQEAFLQLYRYRRTVDMPGAYVRKVATRMALRLPPEAPHQDIADAGGGVLPADSRPEGRHLVRQALAQLPQQQRVVFALHLDDYSDSQIASILGLGTATVRSYRRHARRTLHRWYEQTITGPEGALR